MKSLRDVIAEALCVDHGHAKQEGGTNCRTCRRRADAVRDALMANEWMRLVLIEKYREIADQYPADIFLAEGTTKDAVSGTAIRTRMLAEIAFLKEAAGHAA